MYQKVTSMRDAINRVISLVSPLLDTMRVYNNIAPQK